MANYTEDEVRGSVEKMLGSGTRFRKNALGGRELEVAFSDIQRSLALVFMLRPRAVFYSIARAATKLLALLHNELAALEELSALIEVLSQQSAPVVDVTPLGNAAAAIRDMTVAVGQRSVAPRALNKTPAYARFVQHVDSFIRQSLVPNVATGTVVTQSPEEARSLLPQRLKTLEAMHRDVVRRARLLSGAMTAYMALDLPAKLASTTLDRVRAEVLDTYSAYMATSPSGRVELARSALLTLLTAKSLVLNVSALRIPSVAAEFPAGTHGGAFASSDYPANAAAVITDISGPWSLSSNAIVLSDAGRTLTVHVDDVADPVTVVLTPPLEARLYGAAAEPFVFTDSAAAQLQLIAGPYSTAAMTDRRFELYFLSPTAGTVRLQVLLPVGVAISAAQVATAISDELGVLGLAAEFACSDTGGHPTVVATAPGTTYAVTVGARAEANTLLGVAADARYAGTDDNRTLSFVANGTEYTVTMPAGSLSATDAASAVAVVAGVDVLPTAYPALGPKCLQLTSKLAGYGSYLEMLASPAQQVLGFVAGASARSTALSSSDVARQLTRVSPLLEANAVDTTVLSRVSGRASGATAIVLFRVTGVSAQLTPVGATDVQATLGDGSFDGVAAGDQLRVLSGVNAGKSWTVTVVTPAALLAVGAVAPVPSADIVEVLPSIDVVGLSLVVLGGVNASTYRVTATDATFPAVLTVDRPVLEYPATFVTNVVQQRVRLASRSAALNSQISVDGGAAAALFSAPPAAATGTSPWVVIQHGGRRLSMDRYEVEIGDNVDVFATNYAETTRRHTVTALNTAATGGTVLRVDPPFLSTENADTWLLQNDAQPPFAKVTNQDRERLERLQSRLALWLSEPVNNGGFFRALSGFTTPLVTNTMSARAAVNAAKSKLFELHNVLGVAGSSDAEATLEYALTQHRSSTVPAVDDILQLLRSRGCGRAADVLLAADLPGFFALSSSTASYTGALLEASQQVVQNDLSISRFGRTSASEAIRLAAFQENDAEYDDIDPEQPGAPDVPTGNVP